jgi:CBS domain containing-hemolysin-like protein
MIDVHSDKSALRRKLKECEFTRLLVHEGRPDNIVGFVNIYDALYSSAEFADLHGLVRPLRRFSANVTVAHAIDRMRAESQKIALVMRTSRTGRERPVGIVTMKDLAEELLGELAEW